MKKGVKQLGYNIRSINYMTNNFILNDFFETNQAMGVILITPKQVAISYGSIKEDLIHIIMIQNMLKVLKIEGNNPIIAMRCYSYNNKNGGCVPLVAENKKITQEMYDVIDKIYEKVTAISSDIIAISAKELVESENLEIDNSDVEDEKIIGIKLEDFIKRLDSQYREDIEEKTEEKLGLVTLIKRKLNTIKEKNTKGKQEKLENIKKSNKLDEYKIENSDNQIEKNAIGQQENINEQEVYSNQENII